VNENGSLIDYEHSTCLQDVGQVDYIAALAVAADGTTHLILADREAIGDDNVTYDPTCSDAVHEQIGALPLEYVRRLTISQRMNRCGRRTKSGAPCQTPVTRPGDTCAWHRTGARA
jgi:hypothetical protein